MRRHEVIGLRDRLLTAVTLAVAGCSQSAGDPVVPATSADGAVVVSSNPAPSQVALPSKDPSEQVWRSPEGVACMPREDTVNASPGQCGAPGPGMHKSPHGCSGRCSYSLDAAISASESRRRRGDACCFQAVVHHYRMGRPFEGPNGALFAQVEARPGWGRDLRLAARRRTSMRVRLAVAEAYRADAVEEHASIAAFARLSLELLRLGAPAALVRLTHQAALDEVRHAADAFAIASALAGESVGPGPLPVATALPPATTRAALFEETLRGGCVGESLSAALALEAGLAAGDTAVRDVLLGVAEDEARHAELAIHVAVWCFETASREERTEMRELLRSARSAPIAPREEPSPNASPGELAWLGRLTPQRRRVAELFAREFVVAPMLAALERALA